MAKRIVSGRGPRNAKLTILVPQSLLDDLRALREATIQSTGDLLNNLIEAELNRQSAALAEGRELLRAKEERAGRTKAAPEASGGSAAKKHQGPTDQAAASTPKRLRLDGPINIPTAADVGAWAETATYPDELTKRKADGEAFIEWIHAKGYTALTTEIVAEYRAILGERYPNPGTAKTHASRINGLVRWLDGRKG